MGNSNYLLEKKSYKKFISYTSFDQEMSLVLVSKKFKKRNIKAIIIF